MQESMQESIPAIRNFKPGAFVSDSNAAVQCHSCGTPMRRTVWRCTTCGRQNRLYTRGQVILGLVLAALIVFWLRTA